RRDARQFDRPEPHAPAVRRREARDETQQRRLATTGRSEQANEFGRRRRKRDVVERDDRTERLADAIELQLHRPVPRREGSREALPPDVLLPAGQDGVAVLRRLREVDRQQRLGYVGRKPRLLGGGGRFEIRQSYDLLELAVDRGGFGRERPVEEAARVGLVLRGR